MWARNALAEKEHEFCKAQDEIYQKHKKNVSLGLMIKP